MYKSINQTQNVNKTKNKEKHKKYLLFFGKYARIIQIIYFLCENYSPSSQFPLLSF